jgi:hypothetical protein
MVFMVIALSGPEVLQSFKDDKVGLVFEYLDKAGPGSVNGLPTFFSCQIASEDDAARIFAKVKALGEAEASVLSKSGSNEANDA